MQTQTETQLVHSFARNQEERIQIILRKYKDKYYVDLRVWFQTEEDSTLRPTKRGISLALEQLPELRKGMERLLKAAEKFRGAEKDAL